MEPKGVGQAEMEGVKRGHESNTAKKQKLHSGLSEVERQRKRERAGKSDENRCLGDEESSLSKKRKILNQPEQKMQDAERTDDQEKSELFQHVSEKEEGSEQVMDAATQVNYENHIKMC